MLAAGYGDNYYVSDSVYKLYTKELKQYCNAAPICYLLSPELTIMGTDVEPYSSGTSAVYQISQSLRGIKASTSFRFMARQAIRGQRGKPASKEFKDWYVSTYHINIDSLKRTSK